MSFARATTLEDLGDGLRRAHLVAGWDAFGGVANGGYLLAVAARAATHATAREDPITVTAHYLGPARSGGDVDITTRVRKSGRQFATASVEMAAEGSALLTALATCGTAPDVGPDLGPVDLPPPEECPRIRSGDPLPPPMANQVETRLHPADDFLTRPTGHARIRGWFRLLDGEPLSTLAAVLATDTWPPPMYAAHGPTGWMATIELTVHVRARPAGEWLACRFDRNVVAGATVSWDGTITDEHGRLVATCRQLALMPRG